MNEWPIIKRRKRRPDYNLRGYCESWDGRARKVSLHGFCACSLMSEAQIVASSLLSLTDDPKFQL